MNPEDVVGDQAVGFAVHGRGRIRRRRLDETDTLPSPSGPLLEEAADAAAAAADPVTEPHCSAGYRRHALRVLTRRSLAQAVPEGAPA